MLYLPDTNACSHFMRGHPVLIEHWIMHAPSIRLSALVVAELEYGAAKSASAKQQRRVTELASSLPFEPFSREDTLNYARLRAFLERRGQMIGPIDTLIAAQALRLGATVVTHNLTEFKRVPKLKVADWQAA